MSANTAARRVVVYGGSGALGNELVNYFKTKSYVKNIFLCAHLYTSLNLKAYAGTLLRVNSARNYGYALGA